MASWDGSRATAAHSSRDSERTPRWSPDGKYLAFLAARGGDRGGRAGLAARSRRRRGAARSPTSRAASPTTPGRPTASGSCWSSTDPSDPNDDEEEGEEAQDAAADRHRPLPFQAGRRPATSASSAQHLYAVRRRSRRSRVADAGPLRRAARRRGRRTARRSRSSASAAERSGSQTTTDIYVIDAQGRRDAAAAHDIPGRQRDVRTSPPAGARTASEIAYRRRRRAEATSTTHATSWPSCPRDGGAPRVADARRSIATSTSPVWSRRRPASIYVPGRGRSRPATRARPGRRAATVERLIDGRRVVGAFAVGADGTHRGARRQPIAAARSVRARRTATLRRLTHQNDDWLGEVQLGDDRGVHVDEQGRHRGPRPASSSRRRYVPGRSYPTLLCIHGGPDAQDEHSFGFERADLRRATATSCSP